MQTEIEGIKVIYHNVDGIDEPDDPSYPFMLEVFLGPPRGFLAAIHFVFNYGGSEKIVVRAMTGSALEKFIREHDLRREERLQRFIITGPDGIIENRLG